MKVKYEMNLSDKILASIRDIYGDLVQNGVPYDDVVSEICDYLVDDNNHRFDFVVEGYQFGVNPSGSIDGRVLNEELEKILSNHEFSDKELIINMLTMSFLELNFYRESQGIVLAGTRASQMQRFLMGDVDIIKIFKEDSDYRKNVVSDALFYMDYSSSIYNYNIFKTLFHSEIGDVIYNIFPSIKDNIDPRVEDLMYRPDDVTLLCKFLEIEQTEIEKILIREKEYPDLSADYFRFRNNLLSDSLLQSVIWNKYNDYFDIKPDVFSDKKLITLEMIYNILSRKKDSGVSLGVLEDKLLNDIELNSNGYEELFNYYDKNADIIVPCLINNFDVSYVDMVFKHNKLFDTVRHGILEYYKERNRRY